MSSFVYLDLKRFLQCPALLRPKVGDSRSEGCQPSREHYCDVRRNRFERHSGLDGCFHVRFWMKAGSPHYGSSIFDLKSWTLSKA